MRRLHTRPHSFPWAYELSITFAFVSLLAQVRQLTRGPLTTTGDKLLVQMGTDNPGRTEHQKNQYVSGMRALMDELRKQGTKDANYVASRIAQYRREFLNDSSNILNLA